MCASFESGPPQRPWCRRLPSHGSGFIYHSQTDAQNARSIFQYFASRLSHLIIVRVCWFDVLRAHKNVICWAHAPNSMPCINMQHQSEDNDRVYGSRAPMPNEWLGDSEAKQPLNIPSDRFGVFATESALHRWEKHASVRTTPPRETPPYSRRRWDDISKGPWFIEINTGHNGRRGRQKESPTKFVVQRLDSRPNWNM